MRPVAILYGLYTTLGELRLRRAGSFVGAGKYLPRMLRACDPAFAAALDNIMLAGHRACVGDAQNEQLMALPDKLGGYVFDGYRQEAPTEMRAEPRWLARP